VGVGRRTNVAFVCDVPSRNLQIFQSATLTLEVVSLLGAGQGRLLSLVQMATSALYAFIES
jgi:hypothetical protein